MPREHKPTANIGVSATQLVVERFGWIFRRQTENDYGIDAHVEVCENAKVRGGLVGIQVKSGPSYFTKKVLEGWVLPISLEHRDYWLYGTLPVVVVLYDTTSDKGYWQVVSDTTVVPTGKSAKIIVPQAQSLEHGFRDALAKLATGPAWLGKYRQLALARDWMEEVQRGVPLVIEFTDKVNTMTPRGEFKVWVGGAKVQEWPFYVRGLASHEDVLDEAFPWADARPDEVHEDEKFDDLYEAECGYHDAEGNTHYRMTRKAFAIRMEGHDPDLWLGNEFSTKSYFLTLNGLGLAFLTVYRHLHGIPASRGPAPSSNVPDSDFEWDDDPIAERARVIARAEQFGFTVIDAPATCTVSVMDTSDPALERSRPCGRAIAPGVGFKRWEMSEQQEVRWCWDCVTGILWVD